MSRALSDKPILQRWALDDAGCWLWLGSIQSKGYGKLPGGYLAHRFFYETLVGPIDAGLQIDHTCEVRRCVNPAHLEPVTHQENQLRRKDRRGR